MAEIEAPDTCGSCRFCARVNGEFIQGQCRGAPPTPVVVGMTREGPHIMSLFPMVDMRTPACRIYEKRETVIIGQTQGQA